ncbi:MAG: beta-ketoacyl-ACP synthase II [Fibrobacter sp.]|nr:beta-ketoacyl-ACP synthase II [Fibrobacter sp.]
MEEIVVTGMGVVSSLGHSPEQLWENLLAGKSGVSTIDRFDVEKYSVKIGGQVRDFDPTKYYSERDARRTARNIQYAVHAAESALEMAKLDPADVDVTRCGVNIGSGMGGMEVFYDNAVVLEKRGPRRVSPFFVPMAISNMAAGEVGIRLKWMGPNWSLVSACATANHAFITACDQIRMGRADVMLAGGCEEAVCDIGVAGFAAMKALSTRNDDPEAASRPFDKDRDGFIISEGAGVLVLESLSHAKKRGAPILARIAGYGMSCDGHHMSAPREDGLGVANSMNMAVKDARINMSQVGYVNTHGTSTPLGDVAEAAAIVKAFGADISRIKVNSTKSMTGHALGAAAGLEAIATIMSLRDQKVHKTLNLDNIDERIDPSVDLCAEASNHAMEYAMSNSFGFGGHNSTVIFAKA